MKDTETGRDLWRWNEKLTDFEAIDIKNPYQFDKYLVFQQDPRGYCIDLSDGKTVFRNQQGTQMENAVSGLGTTYFLSGNSVDSEAQGFTYDHDLWKGDVRILGGTKVLQPTYSRRFIRQIPAGKVAGQASAPHAFVQGNDTLVAFTYWEPASLTPDDNDFRLSLYNLSSKVYVYNGVAASGGSRLLYSSGDRIIFPSGRGIYCHRLSDGKKLWENTSFGQDFSFSGLVLVGDKVIGNNEDTYLYALDLETGRTLWKEKSNGTSSRLVYLDGVVYYVAGGLLHAVEAATGKHLWRLKSPDVALDRGAFFFGFAAAVPGKDGGRGRIVASTGLNAYCYEAAR